MFCGLAGVGGGSGLGSWCLCSEVAGRYVPPEGGQGGDLLQVRCLRAVAVCLGRSAWCVRGVAGGGGRALFGVLGC